MLLTGKYGASKQSTAYRIPNDYHPAQLRRQWQGSRVTVKSEFKTDEKYDYPVRLDWENNPHMERWNEVCAWAVEYFGLPGHRYRTEITKDYMIWYFITPEDQLIMTLAWGNDNGTDI
jgi:hypothetical protein